MKVKRTYAPYRNNSGSNYIRIPSFVVPAERYALDVQDNGTLVYRPVRCEG